jgi:pimeloyl-ACP methyl ester carboxylesterase
VHDEARVHAGGRGHGPDGGPVVPVAEEDLGGGVEDARLGLAALLGARVGRELRAAATAFPDVPVVVLSAASGFPLPRRFRAHWTSLQAGLAAAAPRGRHVIVDGTGHNIPGTRPDVVADAILAVAAQVRAAAS